jgi:membrane-bound ClpP family serine protease
LAVALLVIDAFALAHGILTGGGIAASLIGGLVFFDPSDPLFRLLRGCIIEGVIVWAASFTFGISQGLRAQRLPIKVGTETMLGKTVNALTPINARAGKVLVRANIGMRQVIRQWTSCLKYDGTPCHPAILEILPNSSKVLTYIPGDG